MDALLGRISELYGLTFSQVPERIAKGVLSENYSLVSNKGRFFLKKYRFESETRIKEIHSAKQYFADSGIPVILPIRISHDLTFFSFNESFYALFPFVVGKHLERGELTDHAIASMGEMLGRIHLAGRDSTISIIEDSFSPWNRNAFNIKAAEILEKMPPTEERNDFDNLSYESIRLKKSIVEKNSIRYEDLGFKSDYLIHGDYLDHNVFFSEADEVDHVFDFEKTQYSPRTFELFRSLMYSLLSNSTSESDIQKAKVYLSAYRTLYPIENEELKRGLEMFYLKSIHNVWVEHEHYVKENFRPDLFLEPDLKRIQFLSNNLDRLAEALF
ncbi:MAG: phosphotransferase [bacterium]|nr:phosphotransferase [bacterium]